MDIGEHAGQGRSDGQKQIGSLADCMRFRHQFQTAAHWNAYVTGFYRAAGYPGSGNRRQRRHAAKVSR
jgi:hypothetical protein